MKKHVITVNSLEELTRAAKDILKVCPNQKIFAIYGEMGAGKTTLVKHIVQQLGAVDEAASPTFSLINEYKIEDGSVFHIDLYRLNSKQEALDIGIEEYIYSGEYCFIEWPDLIEALLPENSVKLSILAEEGGTRVISIESEES